MFLILKKKILGSLVMKSIEVKSKIEMSVILFSFYFFSGIQKVFFKVFEVIRHFYK